jgi:hypothetical protein
MKLRDLAHARTGDKGNHVNISVIAYDARQYRRLAVHLTAERVKDHFTGIAHGSVTRYALPELAALNFMIHDALAGGVTRSLALDAHGKSLSSFLLEMEIPDD